LRSVAFLVEAVRLALRNLSRRRMLTLFMFLSIMAMTMGFLLIVTVSEEIALRVWSFKGSEVLSIGHLAGSPYWCDVVMVPEKDERSIPDSVLSDVLGFQGVEWAEPFIGVIPNEDRFSGEWSIRKPDGRVLKPTPVMPLIEGVDPSLELTRLGNQLKSIRGRFLREGERGVVLVGEPLARVFEIEVNDTIVIPHTMRSIFGFFSIKRDAELGVVGIYRTGTEYDKKMLTTLEEAQSLYGLEDHLTCVLVKFLPYGNRTKMIYELNRIPGAEVFVPVEKRVMMVTWSGFRPIRVSTATPTKVMRVAHAQIFLIAIFVTGAFIASSTSSKLYERRHEIGLLKSIGFGASFIQLQVVVETLIVGFTAGVIGFLAANSIALISQSRIFPWLPSFALKMSTGWFLLVLALSSGLSIISAYIPALKASRVPPMEAMRGL